MVSSNLAFANLLDEQVCNKPNTEDSPIKWTSVSLSDVLKRGNRLEASVFDVVARQALKVLHDCKYPLVNLIGPNGPVINAHYGARLKRNYVDKLHDGAVGFIGSSEMLDCQPRPIKFMVDDENTKELHVKYHTVLISRSGTIGNLTFVNRTLKKLLISEHAMRLECDLFPGYVYAFLKSKIGHSLVTSNIYGAVVQQIEPEHLSRILIPNAPDEIKKQIHDLIVHSYDLRDCSNELINQATQMLIDALHFPPIEEFDVKLYKKHAELDTFSVSLSKMSSRMDASYHIPLIDAVLDHLKKNAGDVMTIGNPCISKKVILPGRFRRVYVDEGYGRIFIGGKQLFELDPSNKKYLSTVHHKKLITEQLELHENMTLITCSGTIGKVNIVGKHWEGWTANQHIIRIIPSSREIAGYLYIFLQSDYGHSLINRYTYGSVVDEIDDNHVRQIVFPLLKDKGIQDEINTLALEANELRYEAYRAEQEALKQMNQDVLYAN